MLLKCAALHALTHAFTDLYKSPQFLLKSIDLFKMKGDREVCLLIIIVHFHLNWIKSSYLAWRENFPLSEVIDYLQLLNLWIFYKWIGVPSGFPNHCWDMYMYVFIYLSDIIFKVFPLVKLWKNLWFNTLEKTHNLGICALILKLV